MLHQAALRSTRGTCSATQLLHLAWQLCPAAQLLQAAAHSRAVLVQLYLKQSQPPTPTISTSGSQQRRVRAEDLEPPRQPSECLSKLQPCSSQPVTHAAATWGCAWCLAVKHDSHLLHMPGVCSLAGRMCGEAFAALIVTPAAAVLSKKEANTTAQDSGRGAKFRQMKAEQAARKAANTAGQVRLATTCSSLPVGSSAGVRVDGAPCQRLSFQGCRASVSLQSRRLWAAHLLCWASLASDCCRL